MANLVLRFINQTKANIPKQELSSHLEQVLRARSAAVTVEIELIIVGDHKIQQLNNKYRKVFQSTDVLAFPAVKTVSGGLENFYGSIVISWPQAVRQAKQANINPLTEVKYLAAHGFLHLLGFNHH